MLATISKGLSQLANHHGFRRYFFNTSWMFLEQTLRLISGLFVGIYVARYLEPEQFGTYSYVVAFVALFTPINRLGLDGIVVRELVNRPEQHSIYLGTAFWLKLIGAAASMSLVSIAIYFSNNDYTTNLYIFIAASGLCFQAFDVVQFYFQSAVLSKYISISRIIQLSISSLLKIYLVFINSDLFWFVVITVFDQLILAVFFLLSYWKKNRTPFIKFFRLSCAKSMIKNSWPIILSGVAITLYMRVDQIMIKEMLGDREVGIYSAAARLSEAWYFAPVIITTSLFPAILNAKKIDLAIYNQRLTWLYRFMVYSALGVAIPVSLFSQIIILTLYGNQYYGAGLVLSIHVWAGIFVALGTVNGSWFLAENLQKKATINTLIGVAINVLLNYFLLPVYGIAGAAYATLISYSTAAYLTLFLHQETRQQFYIITSAIFSPTRKSTSDSI